MHLILLITAGLFLGTLAIFLAILLAPVVVGFLVFAGALVLAAVIGILEWIDKLFTRKKRRERWLP